MIDGFFFIIGAQRCGTTFLYHLLDEHPQIQMALPVYPEPKFFLNEEKVRKGIAYYLTTYFPKDQSDVIRKRGEKSTSYIEHPDACYRMLDLCPSAQAVIILRNPVDRAISNYYFSRKHKLETRSLNEVFLEEKPPPKLDINVSTDPFAYLARGKYIDYLKRCERIFSREKMGVVIYEDLVEDVKQIPQLYQFLGVDHSYQPRALPKRVNDATIQSEVKNALKDHLGHFFEPYNQQLEDYLGQHVPW